MQNSVCVSIFHAVSALCVKMDDDDDDDDDA